MKLQSIFITTVGKLVCFDEIHKYPNWSVELKSIHDTFTCNPLILLVGANRFEW